MDKFIMTKMFVIEKLREYELNVAADTLTNVVESFKNVADIEGSCYWYACCQGFLRALQDLDIIGAERLTYVNDEFLEFLRRKER